MIPQRIALRGFLCYREEQEINLDGASLWLLSGLNGSGKSAMFDAVTYALFGGHRGGLAGAQALINKNSNNLEVEFDFLLDEQFYQARRTLKVNSKGTVSGTQQIRRWQGRWETVPDTSNRAGFDAWVRENIGLTFETFTSSVLLMQGKAEKLLAAAPKERFEVLAGIVDLSRYQRLFKRADDRRRAMQGRLETLQHQLSGLAEVSDEELAEADRQTEASRTLLQQIQAHVIQLQRLELLAEHWTELQAKLSETRRQWERGQALLAEARTIEWDWERLHELQEVLPHLENGAEQWARLRQSAQLRQAATAERQRLAERLAQLDKAVAQLEQQRLKRQTDFATEEEQALALAEELRTLLVAALLLRQLQRERDQVRAARQRLDAAVAQQQAPELQAKQLEADYPSLVQELDAATKVRQQADHAVTQTRTLLDEARKQSERFYSVVGEKVCRYCGQALTPGHVLTEKEKLAQELASAEANYRQALKVQADASRREKRREEARRKAEHLLNEARQHVAECQQHQQEARRDALRHAEACTLAYQELGEPFRARVTSVLPEDWLATTYPTTADLTALQSRRTELEAGAAALQASRVARRKQARLEQEELARLGKEREVIQQQLADKDRQVGEEGVRRTACQEVLAAVRAALPAAWKVQVDSSTLAADLLQWQAERASLEARGAEARVKELRQVQAGLEPLRLRLAELEREREDTPEEARRDPTEVRTLLAHAQQEQTEQEETLFAAQQVKQHLLQRREHRQQLQAECLREDRQHKLYSVLADLLGRGGLQLHLVREAERSIVDCANAVLDRLSAGQLYLRLRGEDSEAGDADQALQLEAYNRTAGQSPIAVAFLSGSQRFRVAVSLALGIGQYACRRHRPIESVIID
jgi:DNA repair exonuclease SbcCD ATPase subunit